MGENFESKERLPNKIDTLRFPRQTAMPSIPPQAFDDGEPYKTKYFDHSLHVVHGHYTRIHVMERPLLRSPRGDRNVRSSWLSLFTLCRSFRSGFR